MVGRTLFHAGAVGVLCLNALGSNALAARDGPTVLEPLGPWQLDMGDNTCRLARVFGTEDDKTLFLLDQWDPSPSVFMTIAGGATKSYGSRRAAAFAFGPDGDAEEFDFLPSTYGQFGAAVRTTTTIAAGQDEESTADRDGPDGDGYGANPRGLPHLDAEGAEGITYLAFGRRAPDDVRLNLGAMKEPLEAMNRCMANLVEHWGFDVEEQKTVVRAPTSRNMNDVAKRIISDYPRALLKRGAQADFHLRITVDAEGRVADCAMINQTVVEDFDPRRHPCAIYKEIAEFDPATNAAGKPVPSYFVTRIVYRIPN